MRDYNQAIPSQLAGKLLKDWAWAQDLASEASPHLQQSESSLPDLDFLAGLGTGGRYPNNMHRDVEKYFSSSLPHLFYVQVPFKGNQKKTIGLILPHEPFATVRSHYSLEFFYWRRFEKRRYIYWKIIAYIGKHCGQLI